MKFDGFQRAQKVEQRAWDGFLYPFFKSHAKDAAVVTFDKGRLALELQASYGDAVFNSSRNGDVTTVECKAEEKHTGNLFIETWSNRKILRPGWLQTQKADVLAYFFLDVSVLYVMRMSALQDWAFGDEPGTGNLWHYSNREVRQSKYDQHNDTWGRLVSVRSLARSILVTAFDLAQGGFPVVPVDNAADVKQLELFG